MIQQPYQDQPSPDTTTTGSANLSVGNPMLAPLGNYGGPTQTLALLPGSPAIGNGATEPGTFDQRGVARPFNAPSDIGAFQTSSDPASQTVTQTFPLSVGSLSMLTTASGATLSAPTETALSTLPALPVGATPVLQNVTAFTVSNVDPGGSATVVIQLPAGTLAPNATYAYFKYDPANPSSSAWVRVNPGVATFNVTQQTITLNLQDDGVVADGDEDAANNGDILDPGIPVTVNPMQIATTTLAAYLTVNVPADNQTIATSGGTGPDTFALASGILPIGLSLNPSTGAINGTPTTAATFGFTVTATDSVGTTASQSYSVEVLPAAFAYNPATRVLTITGGQFYFTQATTADSSGTHTSYTFTIDGVTQTFPDTALSSVLVNGAGAGSSAILVTNDTYLGADGKTHETAESVQSGPGGGTIYKFDANGNAIAFLTLSGFPTTYAYVGRADQAQLKGVVGNGIENVLVTAGNYSYEFGGGEFHLISGAAVVYGYAVNSTDQDWQYDAAGSLDAFVASGNAFNYMSGRDTTGNTFFNVAVGFPVSYGISTHGDAIAYLIDSPGNDTFVGNATVSYLSGSDSTGNVFNVAEAFALIYAESFVGGTDFAYNYDPNHNILSSRWIMLT